MTEERIRQQEEMKLREGEFQEKEKELKAKADAWVKEKMGERMGSVGVDEAETRKQLEIEAEKWVQWNLEQYKEGKPGTASPEEGLGKLHGAKIPEEKPW